MKIKNIGSSGDCCRQLTRDGKQRNCQKEYELEKSKHYFQRLKIENKEITQDQFGSINKMVNLVYKKL